MNVLKNNYNKNNAEQIESYPKNLICGECKSELEYEKADIRIGELGMAFVDCPLCGYENVLEDNGIILTMDNIEFPVHFWHTSTETGAVEVCNNENVKKEIKRAIEYFRNNKDEYSWSTQYGNMFVMVNKYDGDEEYQIIVANDYYESDIQFIDNDY